MPIKFSAGFDIDIDKLVDALNSSASLDSPRYLDIIEQDVQERFASADSYLGPDVVVSGGIVWESLRPRTQLERTRLGFTGKKLERTGQLRQTFQQGNSNNVAISTQDSITFGSTLDRSDILQEGAPSRNLPPRPQIVFSAELQDALDDAIESNFEMLLSGF